MQKYTVYHTIAFRNPREAYNMLAENGYRKMKKDPAVIQAALADFVNKHKEEALAKIAKIHPDKELFEKEPGQENPELIEKNQPGAMKSCDACDLKTADGECKFKGADAKPPVTKEPAGKKFALTEKSTNILIMAGAGVFVITALVYLIKKAK